MSTNSGSTNNSDNPDNSSSKLGEQDQPEKVEVGNLLSKVKITIQNPKI